MHSIKIYDGIVSAGAFECERISHFIAIAKFSIKWGGIRFASMNNKAVAWLLSKP